MSKYTWHVHQSGLQCFQVTNAQCQRTRNGQKIHSKSRRVQWGSVELSREGSQVQFTLYTAFILGETTTSQAFVSYLRRMSKLICKAHQVLFLFLLHICVSLGFLYKQPKQHITTEQIHENPAVSSQAKQQGHLQKCKTMLFFSAKFCFGKYSYLHINIYISCTSFMF